MGLEIDQLDLLLSHQLPPVRTSAGAGDDEDGGFATPTAPASVLPAPSACPPAPRKPRPGPRVSANKRRRFCCDHRWRGRRYWIVAVPRDLDLAAVFVKRPPPSSSAAGGGSLVCSWPPAAAGKKIRVHVAG